ncbi:MAG: hypothetical protein COW03_14590 [Cytophagales bacterium CG12_big_fil_rev_8_21_14_0_65_40_12]|nr:MAG: hypothetical protein COW03_14590 [Cytophagales bacterium CG12_big_fil_rev_8_21_14_0_65_40_12]PIW04329.1 MAG: hypothetical protein COW40_10320 [Cytophagales bacterium CG17_big_fil_post_rev_8_21_14_2_50_40_13]
MAKTFMTLVFCSSFQKYLNRVVLSSGKIGFRNLGLSMIALGNYPSTKKIMPQPPQVLMIQNTE